MSVQPGIFVVFDRNPVENGFVGLEDSNEKAFVVDEWEEYPVGSGRWTLRIPLPTPPAVLPLDAALVVDYETWPDAAAVELAEATKRIVIRLPAGSSVSSLPRGAVEEIARSIGWQPPLPNREDNDDAGE